MLYLLLMQYHGQIEIDNSYHKKNTAIAIVTIRIYNYKNSKYILYQIKSNIIEENNCFKACLNINNKPKPNKSKLLFISSIDELIMFEYAYNGRIWGCTFKKIQININGN